MFLFVPLLILVPAVLIAAFAAINRANPNWALFLSLSFLVLTPLWIFAAKYWLQTRSHEGHLNFSEALAQWFAASAMLGTLVLAGTVFVQIMAPKQDTSKGSEGA